MALFMEEEIEQRYNELINKFKSRSLRSLCKKLGLDYQSFLDFKTGRKKILSREDFEMLEISNINPFWVEKGIGDMMLRPSVNTASINFGHRQIIVPDINQMTVDEMVLKLEELKPLQNYILKLEKIISINKDE